MAKDGAMPEEAAYVPEVLRNTNFSVEEWLGVVRVTFMEEDPDETVSRACRKIIEASVPRSIPRYMRDVPLDPAIIVARAEAQVRHGAA